MIFWAITIVMLAFAVMLILAPLARKQASENSVSVDETEIYRDQILQLDALAEQNGGNSEAELQERAEIGRRLIKESRAQSGASIEVSGQRGVIFASLAALVVLPILTIGTYSILGSPGTPDAPVSAQRAKKLQNQSIEEMVRIAEKHLAKNPDDARGWSVLADVYGRLDRSSDRANALQQLIRLTGQKSDLLAELGEALTVANGNIVSIRARQIFQRALSANPDTVKANVYLTIALEQEGRFEDALKGWQQLSNLRADDQQWQTMTAERVAALRSRLAGAGQELGGPSQDDIENAATMSAAERTAMIEGMVENLAEKLKDEPDNLKGWIRLIRSYAILKRSDDALRALQNARQHFQTKEIELAQLNELAEAMEIKEKTEGAIN